MILPISGRFEAAAIKLLVCSAKYCGDFPPLSCNIKLKPAELPRPGIGGGPNANAVPSVISVAIIALAFCTNSEALCSRSSHGSKTIKAVAVFGLAVPDNKSYPLMMATDSMPSTLDNSCCTFVLTASVLFKDAASGSCIAIKK